MNYELFTLCEPAEVEGYLEAYRIRYNQRTESGVTLKRSWNAKDKLPMMKIEHTRSSLSPPPSQSVASV